jgi:adenylate kinase
MATIPLTTEQDTKPAADHPVLLLLGPPGCGKGTQAMRLAARLGIPAISTGEIIRGEIASATPLGRLAQAVTLTGGLLDDPTINKLVEARLGRADCARGFLLDGYPRSVPQAEFLNGLLGRLGFPPPAVVHIDVPHAALLERTCLRRNCPSCGKLYNLKFTPPSRPGLCDACGVALRQRADDCEDTVRARLAAYDKTTAPLLAFYAGPRYLRVDGTGAPQAIFGAIVAGLG